MDDDPCRGKDGDMRSGERGTRGNQVARAQPRQRSWSVKRAGKGEAGGDAFSGEGDERGRGSRF